MTPERTEKFHKVARRRQPNLTVVLENVHDPHNIGAVLRTCDSVGVNEIFVLYTEPQLNEDRLYLSRKTASGALQWVDVHFYTEVEACFEQVKKKYEKIYSTHLSENATDLYALNLTESVAFLFGNEHDGISSEAQKYVDGNFHIPQVGMVESLNISVACAVTLYEAYRQRKKKGFYDDAPLLDAPEQETLFESYLKRHSSKEKRRSAKRLE